MTREKSYAPVASYDQLKLAETAVTRSTTADHIREATRQHGAKIGYKLIPAEHPDHPLAKEKGVT